MKRFLLGVLSGLFLGWATVPFLSASLLKIPYMIEKSDGSVTTSQVDEDDVTSSHAYKWYLTQILLCMKQMNQHLQNIEINTQAVKEKLHA